jgi:hypothetical protein
MPSRFDASPRLVVVGGGLLGDVIVIPSGLSALVLDRSGDTVILGDPAVLTVNHGTLDVAPGGVRLTSSGQFGAIAVNGVALDGGRDLHEGDAFQLGNLVLRYHEPADADQPPGGGQARFSADRDVFAAGRDINHTVRINANPRRWDKAFRNSGVGRLLTALSALGVVTAGIGFVWGMISIIGAGNSMNSASPPTGIPSSILNGFGVFAASVLGLMIVGVIGNTMSDSARRKAGRED